MTFGVQIEFLVSPQLSDPASPRYGEWPPAPDRIFQALVATAAETGQSMEILEHLEAPPTLQAGSAVISPAPLRYVPDNFRRNNRYHQGAARYLPTVLPDNPIVIYVWENVPPAALERLGNIARQITHIGRAASLVRATVVDSSSVEINWKPDPTGHLMLRTPYPGRLSHLKDAYQAGQRSPDAPVIAYKNATESYPSLHWGDLMALRPSKQLAIEHTPMWTEKIRNAVMSKAADDIPALIHGHDDHRHVAWTALPDVGHRYASGGILGLGCWLPDDVTLSERGLIGSLLMRISNVGGIDFQLDPVGLKGLQRSTWSRPSRTWSSVTPIALDRWPKRNNPPEKIITKSLMTMGLPRPLKVVCSNHSPIKSAANPRKYPARKGNRFITHATIEWDTPVEGPILIGADRYFGGGLCRPLTQGGRT